MPFTRAMKIMLLVWAMTAPGSGLVVPKVIAEAVDDVACINMAQAMNARYPKLGTFMCHTEADAQRAIRECSAGCKP
jgi:hypothetical protein